MVKREELPWTEQFRPTKLTGVIGNTKKLKELDEMIEGPSCPHIILNGIHGTGKTTVSAIVACKITGAKSVSDAKLIKIIKGTKEGVVELLRTTVENFTSYNMTGGRKVIIIEESDDASPKFQKALRNDMEEWARKGIVVIMNCNYKEDIEPAIVNRCFVLDFYAIPDDEMLPLLNRIKEAKKLEISEDGVKALLKEANGIPRTLVTLMQTSSANGKLPITADRVLQTNESDSKIILPIVKHAMSGKFYDALDETSKLLNKSTIHEREIVKMVFDHFLRKEMSKKIPVDKEIKRIIIEACAETDFRIKKGAAPLIQMSYLYTRLFIAWKSLLKMDPDVLKKE